MARTRSQSESAVLPTRLPKTLMWIWHVSLIAFVFFFIVLPLFYAFLISFIPAFIRLWEVIEYITQAKDKDTLIKWLTERAYIFSFSLVKESPAQVKPPGS